MYAVFDKNPTSLLAATCAVSPLTAIRRLTAFLAAYMHAALGVTIVAPASYIPGWRTERRRRVVVLDSAKGMCSGRAMASSALLTG